MTYRQEEITPYGNDGTKGEQVERMFDGIAHSYDLLNHTLSFGIDKHWRKAAIKSLTDNAFDAVMVAYGIRNFEDLDRGLSEMCRVMKPGGRLVIIELTAPRRFPMKQLFRLYSHVLMPALGRLISRDNKAYAYLPATMEAFPQGEEMQQILSRAGFKEVRFKRYTFGLSTLYTATK